MLSPTFVGGWGLTQHLVTTVHVVQQFPAQLHNVSQAPTLHQVGTDIMQGGYSQGLSLTQAMENFDGDTFQVFISAIVTQLLEGSGEVIPHPRVK